MNTFMDFERATMQWLVQSYQRRTLRRASKGDGLGRAAGSDTVAVHPSRLALRASTSG